MNSFGTRSWNGTYASTTVLAFTGTNYLSVFYVMPIRNTVQALNSISEWHRCLNYLIAIIVDQFTDQSSILSIGGFIDLLFDVQKMIVKTNLNDQWNQQL